MHLCFMSAEYVQSLTLNISTEAGNMYLFVSFLHHFLSFWFEEGEPMFRGLNCKLSVSVSVLHSNIPAALFHVHVFPNTCSYTNIVPDATGFLILDAI